MPAFQPPEVTCEKDKAWIKRAKFPFRNPTPLWNKYWHRYNTITIPLRDEDAYFADVSAAAKLAQSREHLEELLDVQCEERRREYDTLILDIAVACIQNTSLSKTPHHAALKASQTGSLDSLLQVLCGVVFGWKDGDKENRVPRIDDADETEYCIDGKGDLRSKYNTPEISSELADDPFEYDNTIASGLYSPRGWEDWNEDEENLWNDPSWKVSDCPTSETNLSPPGVDEVVVAERGDSDQAFCEHPPEQLDGILKVTPPTDQISPLPSPYLSLIDTSVGLSPHSRQTSSPDPPSACDQKLSASTSARMVDEWQSPPKPRFPTNRADSVSKNEGKKRKLQDDDHHNDNGQKRQKQKG
ncbi:hypothetical protein BDP67DRAFT_536347 [Colletotrichum lupini]|nr:hypothetical protein BDP67DRAFT_536347 [Colletotrichum lupini]